MARASAAPIKRKTAAFRQALVVTILPRAGRVIGNVIAKEARDRVESDEVRGSIKVTVDSDAGGRVTVRIQTVGKGAYIAPWLEYGTDPHFISVAADQRGGKTVQRINRDAKEGKAMVINGQPVAGTIHHPGARAIPFLRPAFDIKMGDAFAAGQRYIDRAVPRVGSIGELPSAGDDE